MAHRTLVFHDDGQPGRVAPFGVVAAFAALLEADVTVARTSGRHPEGRAWDQAIAATAAAGVGVTVTVLDASQPAECWLTKLALYADLFIAPGAGDQRFVESGERRLVERLTHRAGCPFLVLPEHVRLDRPARRVAIAWRPCPPAQRAVLAAMPLLMRADSVAVIVVDPDRPFDDAGALKRFLERRGIAATIQPIVGSDEAAGALIADATDQGQADLLVMGAWSRSRLDRMLVGGATRQLLGKLALPLFISH